MALAVQRRQVSPPTEMLNDPPVERFDWYVVDARQQLDGEDRDREYLYFPRQNRLNLATFSLLWGGLWVRTFFDPLGSQQLLAVPGLWTAVPRVFRTDGLLDDDLLRDWNFLLRDLPKYRGQLDDQVFKEVNFRLGLGNALGIIRSQLYAAAGSLDAIRSYCPEALYGTANLWLFARTYRQFMDTSYDVAHGAKEFNSQRLLPLTAPNPDDVPRILRCALWHVGLIYSLLDTEVKIILRPDHDAGEDHSYYGGGIGYFPWISLTDDQAHWMVERDAAATSGDHLDFLNEQASRPYFEYWQGVSEMARLLKVDGRELLLPDEPPVQMFPAESTFLRHPRELFAPQVAARVQSRMNAMKGRING
ncbi:hypothetical protein ACIA8B_02815 [Micromonospora chalcea]